MDRRSAVIINKLQEELQRLRIAADNIERLLQTAKREQDQDRGENLRVNPTDRRALNYPHNHLRIFDNIGTEMLIGDTVLFLTRGSFSSTGGVVYKISRSGNRVTSRDNLGRSISRSPQNIQVQI